MSILWDLILFIRSSFSVNRRVGSSPLDCVAGMEVAHESGAAEAGSAPSDQVGTHTNTQPAPPTEAPLPPAAAAALSPCLQNYQKLVSEWPPPSVPTGRSIQQLEACAANVRHDMLIDHAQVGRVIGAGGSTYKQLTQSSQCNIFVLEKVKTVKGIRWREGGREVWWEGCVGESVRLSISPRCIRRSKAYQVPWRESIGRADTLCDTWAVISVGGHQ